MSAFDSSPNQDAMAVKEGWTGRVYEDFEVGDIYVHPLGRTVLPVANSWVTLLTQQIKSATVDLTAELAHSETTVRALMALKAGDFIELTRNPTLTAKVDGVPLLECSYGTIGAHYGLRVQEVLTHSTPDHPQTPATR